MEDIFQFTGLRYLTVSRVSIIAYFTEEKTEFRGVNNFVQDHTISQWPLKPSRALPNPLSTPHCSILAGPGSWQQKAGLRLRSPWEGGQVWLSTWSPLSLKFDREGGAHSLTRHFRDLPTRTPLPPVLCCCLSGRWSKQKVSPLAPAGTPWTTSCGFVVMMGRKSRVAVPCWLLS